MHISILFTGLLATAVTPLPVDSQTQPWEYRCDNPLSPACAYLQPSDFCKEEPERCPMFAAWCRTNPSLPQCANIGTREANEPDATISECPSYCASQPESALCILFCPPSNSAKAEDQWTFDISTTDDEGDEAMNIPRSDITPSYCLCTSSGGVCTTDLNICIDQNKAPPVDLLPFLEATAPDQVLQALQTLHDAAPTYPTCVCRNLGDGQCVPKTQVCLETEPLVKRGTNDEHACLYMAPSNPREDDITCFGFPQESGLCDCQNVQDCTFVAKNACRRLRKQYPHAGLGGSVVGSSNNLSKRGVVTDMFNHQFGKACVYQNPSDPRQDDLECFGLSRESGICDCRNHTDCAFDAKMACRSIDSKFPGAGLGGSIVGLEPSDLSKRQAVTELIAPPEGNPANTAVTYNNLFGIIMVGAQDVNTTPPAVWSAENGECFPDGWFLMNLTDGVLTDNVGRRGYIANNNQLQFDDPPQSEAVWTSGFFAGNGVLGLGPNYTFDSCASGEFSNIYNAPIANYCAPVFLKMMKYEGPCDLTTTDDDSE